MSYDAIDTHPRNDTDNDPGNQPQPQSGGATGFVLLAVTVALVGAMLWQANAPVRPASAAGASEIQLGPVTGREFGDYVRGRIAVNPELAERSRHALLLAEEAGDGPVVEVMREYFSAEPAADPR